MNEIYLWLGIEKLSVVFEPTDLSREIVKMCSINDHMFALTKSNIIYHSNMDCSFDKTLVFRSTNISAIDIACNANILFFINSSGQVFKTTPEDLDMKQEIVLEEVSKCCSHGYRTVGQRVKVKSIAAEGSSCFYITENGQLWMTGDQPKLGMHNEIPQKVTFFEKRYVISVACGDNFSIALVYKPEYSMPDKNDSDTDDEKDADIFVSNCPLCISSPTSQQSTSDTWPQVQQISDEHYSTSTTSKNSAEEKKSTDDTTSGSSDCKPDERDAQESVDRNSENKDNECVEEKPGEGGDGENEDRSEKKNEFFINTEAARHFLTRQLSWVSGYGGAGEDLVEGAERSFVRPSQIIRQNVSSVASLVYEGVKTVGDRGATLFRHMSGGSEAGEGPPGILIDCHSFEELSVDDFIVPASSIASSLSCGTSDRCEDVEVGVMERAASLVREGARLLSTELWSWGDITYGQLGTGDTVKRNRPTIISRLTGIGVQQIACGSDHVLAVCLDGRVFAWGRNTHRQVSLESDSSVSSPQQISAIPERIRSVAAGLNHSMIASYSDNIYYIGKGSNKAVVKLEVDNAVTHKHIFSMRHISGCLSSSSLPHGVMQDMVLEQSFLEETLLVHNALIKPLQKKCALVQETNVYDALCTCHTDLMHLTCLHVRSLQEDSGLVMVVHNADEFIRTYRNYLNVVCDVIALGGFAHISRLVDVPHKMFQAFHEPGKKNKKNEEIVVSCALLHPLKRLKHYRSIIQQQVLCEHKMKETFAKWDQFWEEQEQRTSEAETTRKFWDSSGRSIDTLRSPERRLIRESRAHPISVINSGRFSSHWFVLFTDILVHVTGGTHTVHPLTTLWVDAVQDSDTIQNAVQLTVPEDTVILYTSTAQDRTEWLHSLQGAIKKCLHKHHSHPPPAVRNAKYTFSKHIVYKDAKYTGRWCSGKLQGTGKMEWPDGRTYMGQFQNSQMCGLGRMDSPSVSTYEGQWKDGQQNGYGVIKYMNGDMYEGYFKDGLPHGHGVQKQGHFMASLASVYIGEWVNGVKKGYGVIDDIATGEKYLGSWSNNMKHGCGLIVTLDGIYYEGVFMQDILTGHGVMVFEDGTHYEGEFKAAGVFSGKGTLTFNSGDRLEGFLHGAWNEGVKVTGTLHKNASVSPNKLNTKPSSFGKLCVPANQKWKAIFQQCYQYLGISEQCSGKDGRTSAEVQKAWENVAVFINSSQQETLCKERGSSMADHLDTIPQFGRDSLDKESYIELQSYLSKAFESQHHPLGRLLGEVTTAYTATYGGVRVHPLLLNHAVAELHSVTSRLYDVVRVLFPALPPPGHELHLVESAGTEQDSEVVSATSLLHPILLPRIHSALFVLYALHNKDEDDAYWKRLLKWNRQPDMTLLTFLGIDKKFWVTPENTVNHEAFEDRLFSEAVETLQQLKTTFSPFEKLLVIRSTFRQMTKVVQQELGTSYLWTMDDLFPVFHFVVVRSRILQLGSEIHFIEDFMEPYLQNGELGIMFTTLKACYYQILQEKNCITAS